MCQRRGFISRFVPRGYRSCWEQWVVNYGRFCSAISCIDGRVQLPVIQYLRRRFRTSYVDMITEAGPVRLLSDPCERHRRAAIYACLDISVRRHRSVGIALVAHADCAGYPTCDVDQQRQLARGVAKLRRRHLGLSVIGLWVDASGRVVELIRNGGRESRKRPIRLLSYSREATARISVRDKGRLKTAISSRRPSQLSMPSLRLPKSH